MRLLRRLLTASIGLNGFLSMRDLNPQGLTGELVQPSDSVGYFEADLCEQLILAERRQVCTGFPDKPRRTKNSHPVGWLFGRRPRLFK